MVTMGILPYQGHEDFKKKQKPFTYFLPTFYGYIDGFEPLFQTFALF
jgi:hypothetical protein